MKKKLLDAQDEAEREEQEKANAELMARKEGFIKTQKMNDKILKF